jgi:mersacidin/lichenicidin family type 2 lantibiotic
MLRDMIVRAWKDPEYRLSLSEEEQAHLPEHPAGAIELTDDELEMAAGGNHQSYRSSYQSYQSQQSHNRPSYQRESYKSWNRPSYLQSSGFSQRRPDSHSNSSRQSYSWRR